MFIEISRNTLLGPSAGRIILGGSSLRQALSPTEIVKMSFYYCHTLSGQLDLELKLVCRDFCLAYYPFMINKRRVC